MYITNQPKVAQIAEKAGVDRIFIDMEFIGKDERQGGLDTVKNHHTIDDIKNIKKTISKAELLVRVNPIHDELPFYPSSKDEIDRSIEAGADILMLPFFHTVEEVKQFVEIVNGRTKVCLLLETPESANLIDDILEIPGIDMIHIGLNDMHLAMGMDFMFELLANGMVEEWMKKIQAKGIMCGFGGIAGLDKGMLPGAMVLKEHYRLGSQMVIVSRAFCNTDIIKDLNEVKNVFQKGIKELRELESECKQESNKYFEDNHNKVVECVRNIVENKKTK